VVKASIKKEKRAQSQVHRHLATFIDEYDGKGTLLIIYYAGHGWHPRGNPKTFYLLGYESNPAVYIATKDMLTSCRKTDLLAQQDYERNRVAWESAETLLEDTCADVLAIFDCCQAGQLCKFRAPVRFEYLGACGADQQTPVPGPESFTQALIWALNELRGREKFPVSALLEKITKAPNLPKHQRPALSHRFFPSPDHIQLAPMKQQADSAVSSGVRSEETDYRPREFLDLRFHFPVELRDDVIVQTAEALSSLISDKAIKADCISLIGKHVSESGPKLFQIVNQLMESAATAKKAEEIARIWLARTRQNNNNTSSSVDPVASQELTPSVNNDADMYSTSTTLDNREPNTGGSSQLRSTDANDSVELGTPGSNIGSLLETGKLLGFRVLSPTLRRLPTF